MRTIVDFRITAPSLHCIPVVRVAALRPEHLDICEHTSSSRVERHATVPCARRHKQQTPTYVVAPLTVEAVEDWLPGGCCCCYRLVYIAVVGNDYCIITDTRGESSAHSRASTDETASGARIADRMRDGKDCRWMRTDRSFCLSTVSVGRLPVLAAHWICTSSGILACGVNVDGRTTIPRLKQLTLQPTAAPLFRPSRPSVTTPK